MQISVDVTVPSECIHSARHMDLLEHANRVTTCPAQTWIIEVTGSSSKEHAVSPRPIHKRCPLTTVNCNARLATVTSAYCGIAAGLDANDGQPTSLLQAAAGGADNVTARNVDYRQSWPCTARHGTARHRLLSESLDYVATSVKVLV